MNEVEKPGFIKIIFDYPFHLGVPNAFFPIRLDDDKNKIALIGITTREGMQTFDKGKLIRNNPIEGKTDLKFEDAGLETKGVELCGFGEDNQPLFYVIASKHGKSIYPWFFSEVEIIFPVNHIYTAWSDSTNSRHINDLSMQFFNKFLLAYRNASQDVFNKFLSESEDFASYKTLYISEFSEEEKKKSYDKLILPDLIRKRSFKPYPMKTDMKETDIPLIETKICPLFMTNAKKKMIKPEQIEPLIMGGAGVFGIQIFNQILLSGMERYAMDKDYRIAILEFDTAVEVAVMFFLVTTLIKLGKSDLEINKLFDEEDKDARELQRKRRGYLTTHSKIKRLDEHFSKLRGERKLSNINIYKSSECNDWNLLVRKKRNAIVHAWEYFKKDDCEKAFNAAQKFIRFIQKIGGETIDIS
jgi:hypothetical protein